MAAQVVDRETRDLDFFGASASDVAELADAVHVALAALLGFGRYTAEDLDLHESEYERLGRTVATWQEELAVELHRPDQPEPEHGH